jgi:hypothetical protein
LLYSLWIVVLQGDDHMGLGERMVRLSQSMRVGLKSPIILDCCNCNNWFLSQWIDLMPPCLVLVMLLVVQFTQVRSVVLEILLKGYNCDSQDCKIPSNLELKTLFRKLFPLYTWY